VDKRKGSKRETNFTQQWTGAVGLQKSLGGGTISGSRGKENPVQKGAGEKKCPAKLVRDKFRGGGQEQQGGGNERFCLRSQKKKLRQSVWGKRSKKGWKANVFSQRNRETFAKIPKERKSGEQQKKKKTKETGGRKKERGGSLFHEGGKGGFKIGEKVQRRGNGTVWTLSQRRHTRSGGKKRRRKSRDKKRGGWWFGKKPPPEKKNLRKGHLVAST